MKARWLWVVAAFFSPPIVRSGLAGLLRFPSERKTDTFLVDFLAYTSCWFVHTRRAAHDQVFFQRQDATTCGRARRSTYSTYRFRRRPWEFGNRPAARHASSGKQDLTRPVSTRASKGPFVTFEAATNVFGRPWHAHVDRSIVARAIRRCADCDRLCDAKLASDIEEEDSSWRSRILLFSRRRDHDTGNYREVDRCDDPQVWPVCIYSIPLSVHPYLYRAF